MEDAGGKGDGDGSSNFNPLHKGYEGRGGGNHYRGRGGGRGGRGRGGGQNYYYQRDIEEIPIPPELIPENAVDITKEKNGKLWKILLKPAPSWLISATPLDGMVAQIHYKSWLLSDETKEIYDASSLYEGDTTPLEFIIGTRQVIRGVDEGVRSMSKGEKAQFISHFDYAHGRMSQYHNNTTNIPNKSHICTEVELVAIFDQFDGDQQEEDDDAREVVREMMKVCEDGEEMNENTIGFVKLTGFHEEKVFFPVKVLPFISLNDWGNAKADELIPISLGKTVSSMRSGEVASVTLKGSSALQTDFENKFQDMVIKAGAPIKFLVEIQEVEQIFDPFVLSFEEKIDLSKELLEQGKAFLEHDYHDAAFHKFFRVEEYLFEAKDFLKYVPEDLSISVDMLRFQALFNNAKLFGKTRNVELDGALLRCNQAEKLATSSASLRESALCKVYYQRGLLKMEQKEFELARQDFQKVIAVWFDPEDKEHSSLVGEAKKMLDKAVEERKEQKKNYPLRYFPPK